jgi:hypothetical protein
MHVYIELANLSLEWDRESRAIFGISLCDGNFIFCVVLRHSLPGPSVIRSAYMLDQISIVMGLWQEGIMSNRDVVDWADMKITEADIPCYELIDLSLRGPEKCFKEKRDGFPDPKIFSYKERLSLQIRFSDLDSINDLKKLIIWVSINCIGEDLDEPEVKFGYQIDHLYVDCNDMDGAVKLFKSEYQSLDLFEPASKILKSIGAEPGA